MKNKAFLFAILLCLATAHCGKKSADTSSSKKTDEKTVSTVTCFTIGDEVNVRSAASVDAASIEKLPVGSMITVTEESFSSPEVTVKGMKGRWLLLLRKDGKTGYIFSKYIRKLDQMFAEPFVSNDTISGFYDLGWGDTGATDSEYRITISFGDDGRVEENGYYPDSNTTSKGRYQKLGDYLFITFTDNKTADGSEPLSQVVLHLVKCPLDDHEEMLIEKMDIPRGVIKEEDSDAGKRKMYYSPSKR